MKILGLNAFGQNPSACLLIDGMLIGFSHEERFNRLKGSHGLFPSHTINWLLASNGLAISDLDLIAFNWDCNKYPWKTLISLLEAKIRLSASKLKYRAKKNSSNFYSLLQHLADYSPQNMESKIKDELRYFGHRGHIPHIEFINHHLCHAYQAYFHSPFNKTLVLVVDGHGEENCVSGFLAKEGKLVKILNYKIPYSLGWYYSGMTGYLGFFPNRDEGKLMGLAAYGEERKNDNVWIHQLDAVLNATNNGFMLNPYFFKFGSNDYHPRYTNNLVQYITAINRELQPIGTNESTLTGIGKECRHLQNAYIDLAFGVQCKLEDALCAIVKKMVEETDVRNLCYAGGVAMNCKANKTIFDRCSLENIFIHPASSDDGSAIGAAFYAASEYCELKKQPLVHCHFGASYSNDMIEKTLKNCGIYFTKPDDVCSVAAKLLYEGKLLGWFSGAAEMGARALGGRSIIANPLTAQVKDKINNNVKYRESWRPYCPSILDEYKESYLKDAIDSPFMIMAATATGTLRSNCPAVVHVDNTVRPQTVRSSTLPKWAHLLDEFRSLSGHPVILNTSFNIRGEPIVNSPIDAIRTFYASGLEALVIGDYVVTKK
jgi:carbamoyltransferase